MLLDNLASETQRHTHTGSTSAAHVHARCTAQRYTRAHRYMPDLPDLPDQESALTPFLELEQFRHR